MQFSRRQPGSDLFDPSLQQFQRTTRACNRCKQRKIRCEVADYPPCLGCRSRGFECAFGAGPTHRPSDEDRVSRLEAQVAALNGVIWMLSEQLSHHTQWCNESSASLTSPQLPTHLDAHHVPPSTNHTTSSDELELLPPSFGDHGLPNNEPQRDSIPNDSRLRADEGVNAVIYHPFSQASNLSWLSTPSIGQVYSHPEPTPGEWLHDPIVGGAFASEPWINDSSGTQDRKINPSPDLRRHDEVTTYVNATTQQSAIVVPIPSTATNLEGNLFSSSYPDGRRSFTSANFYPTLNQLDTWDVANHH